MASWKSSKMLSICNDGTHILFDYPCEVIINEKRIVVSYNEESHSVIYEGDNHNSDHFRLRCDQNGGYGTLHRFPDENKLEGSWVEGGSEGFWKIELKH